MPPKNEAPERAGLALVLDDEPGTSLVLESLLRKDGWEVITAQTTESAREAIGGGTPDLAVVDVYLQGANGLDFVHQLREELPEIGILVISSEDTSSLAMKAIESGADYFVSKPVSPAAFQLSVRNVFQLREERGRRRALEQVLETTVRERFSFGIITQSDEMQAPMALIEKAAPRDMPVMVSGESGTGKELVARAVHLGSKRKKGPFVEVNCAALPSNLAESELFGHEKGSFTGAVSARRGHLSEANGGSLFLDEIGELPLELQPKLLRALQEKRFQPIGSSKTVESDFRLICATNRDLVREVEEGRFREDLYFRIAVITIQLPPLRRRPADVRLLLDYFLKQAGESPLEFTHGAWALLDKYHWPGNVRELRNFAEALPVYADRGVVDELQVRLCLGSRLEVPQDSEAISHRRLMDGDAPIRNVEKMVEEEMLRALHFYKGSANDAARALGVGRSTLYRYIQRENLDLTGFRD